MCGWVGDEKCLAALRGGHAEKWCVCVCVCVTNLVVVVVVIVGSSVTL